LIGGVFQLCADAEVLFSVVKAIVVEVVNDEIRRRIHNPAVHFDLPSALRTDSVESIVPFRGGPFVTHKGIVIFGVNESELFLCERNSAIGLAEAQKAVKKQRGNTNLIQPYRNID
jgi:hypothetical protein